MKQRKTKIDLDNAYYQQQQYIEALKSAGIKSITNLPPDESLPDCVFVEDTAVVIGSTALITCPGHENRRRETEEISEYFKSVPDMKVVEMDAPAHVDGGDVLFTGREIFVGLSSRSNKKGIQTIQNCFPDYPVHAIRVGNGTLHLKSIMSMAGENRIVAGESDNARQCLKSVKAACTYPYEFLTVPDDDAANCVLVNGTLLHRHSLEYPKSGAILKTLRDVHCIDLMGGELEKVDGSLTCCSLLF